jgi:hypothetical protein
MPCTSCKSHNQAEFTAEMNLHFRGLRNIDNPAVLLFAEVSACLDCGFSKFTIPEAELQKLNEGNRRSTAAQ